MKKPVRVILKEEALEYIQALPDKIQKKFFLAFDKTENGIKGEWFEKMEDTDDLWEFRVSGKDKWHRILAFWDKSGDEETLIVGTHGFEKKTNKTPPKETKKAERIKKEYFAE